MISLSWDELVAYHREHYAASRGDHPAAQFVLKEASDTCDELVAEPQHALPATTNFIDLNELDLDVEALEPQEEYLEQAEQFIQQQRLHKQKFLQEISERGLKLQTSSTTPATPKPLNY